MFSVHLILSPGFDSDQGPGFPQSCLGLSGDQKKPREVSKCQELSQLRALGKEMVKSPPVFMAEYKSGSTFSQHKIVIGKSGELKI